MAENESPKSPLDQALDLLFYAPIGLLANADEVVSDLVRRGRQQVSVAKVFGELAVKQGQKEARKLADRAQSEVMTLFEQLVSSGRAERDAAPQPASGDLVSPASPPTSMLDEQPPAAATPPGADHASRSSDAPDVETLAIPGYDSLAASQVVPRLVSLSADELEAVGRYEKNGRRRKTILNRIAQLQNGA